MGEIRILTQAGDERIEWDPADDAAVTAAREHFDRLKEEGYEFYEVSETRGKKVSSFDRGLGKLLAAPGARKPAEAKVGARPAAMAGGPVAELASQFEMPELETIEPGITMLGRTAP